MLVDPVSQTSWAHGEMAVGEIYDTVIRLGGTVSGEHGIGISKAPYFKKERSSALSTMVAIKKALDPDNIFNPGKMQEWEGGIIRNLRYPCADKD
jgi:glycolate oxidase